MMKYLVVLLSSQSTSFCYCDSSKNIKENKLMSLDILQKAIRYAFIEDLSIQFVLPPFSLPNDYTGIINSTNASTIAPASTSYDADVIVIEGFAEFNNINAINGTNYVFRVKKDEFFEQYRKLINRLAYFSRLNIFFTDVEKFTMDDFEKYSKILDEFCVCVKNNILLGNSIQLNILTDRIALHKMNNCNAGVDTLTLAPDGHFYLCPAFYFANEPPIGNIEVGVTIKNKHLYQLGYAPLCRECDAYQCRRCIFLSKQLTLEVNIPSKEQCVMAHIERNASRFLLNSLREHATYFPETDIKKIPYLDPFDNIKRK